METPNLAHLISQRCTKWGKSTGQDHNFISSEGGQDTSCQISGHFFHALSWECTESPNLNHFTHFFGLCDLEIWQVTSKWQYVFASHKVNIFCKIHDIWVATLGDIALRSVTDRSTDWLRAHKPFEMVARNASISRITHVFTIGQKLSHTYKSTKIYMWPWHSRSKSR